MVCGSGFYLVGRIRNQGRRIEHFAKLKNFDLLLKEQEIEDDESIASLRINKDLFKVDFEQIQMIRIIGEGGSNSTVFLVLFHGSECAFKCFKTRTVCETQNRFDEFEREVQILASLNHPNIIRFFGATLKPPRVGILMEYCSKGELLQFVLVFHAEKSQAYPLSQKLRLLEEICSAMEYLNEKNILHRDLKCENILLDDLEQCRLLDFGLSRIVDRMSRQKTKRIGTSYFMAPELVSSEGGYDEKCDVFSFAIIMYCLISEKVNPYEDQLQMSGEDVSTFGVEFRVSSDPSFRPNVRIFEERVMELYSANVEEEKGSFRNVGRVMLDFLVEIMRRCWDHESKKRFSFKELRKMFSERKNVYLSSEKEVPAKKEIDGKRIIQVSGEKKKKNPKFVSWEKFQEETKTLKVENERLREGYEKMREEYEKMKRAYEHVSTESKEKMSYLMEEMEFQSRGSRNNFSSEEQKKKKKKDEMYRFTKGGEERTRTSVKKGKSFKYQRFEQEK